MLPKIPYASNSNIKQDITFYGLNYTDNYSEGELSEAYGMFTGRYPYLSQRQGRALLSTYSEVSDIYEWDGHLIVTTNSLLYVDGVPIDNVAPGKKQFAVVGNNLIVYPDCLKINLLDNSFERFNATVKTMPSPSTTVFSATNKTITADIKPVYADALVVDGAIWGPWFGRGTEEGFHIFAYGQDEDAVRECWDSVNKEWDMEALAAIEEKCNPWGDLGNKVDGNYGTFWAGNNQLQRGDIIIPQKIGNSFKGVTTTNGDPNKNLYNDEGYYMVVGSYELDDAEWGPTTIWSGEAWFIFYGIGGHVYKAESSMKFSEAFKVGNRVTITGTQSNNFEKVKVTAINDTTNTITIDADVVDETLSTSVTIARYAHDFNYICENGNRLWGVENSTSTIWASQLGDPINFELSDTTDVGAYSVAIGSEGDFTAMCQYGGSVCAWKENRLVKILGDYPSNFYTNEYQIKGVQKDSEKSLCNINEVLYYKGVDGVYAYTGSVPSLISEKLGRDIYTNAAGGTDGSHYYISMKNGTKNNLFSYDLLNGLWMRESDVLADSFATLDVPYYVSNGYVYKMNQDGEVFDWCAEFAPFTEKAKTSSGHRAMFERKNYSKLYLRLDMEEGSMICVYTKEDKGQYKEVFRKSASNDSTITIPVAIGRCDKLQVKLEGKGKVVIEAMAREFTLGSKR